MDTNAAKARDIIANNIYMTIATAGSDGPWAAPVYYAYDEAYNLYFISAIDSRHAVHIAQNPAVSLAIFDSHALAGTGDGVQIAGVARQLTLTELPHAFTTYFRRRFTDEQERIRRHQPARYSGLSRMRFFVVEPLHIFTLDPAIKDVDARIEVRLR